MGQLVFKKGDAVVVKGYARYGRRIIQDFIRNVDGGVILDRPVDRCRCWNVDALRPFKRKVRR